MQIVPAPVHYESSEFEFVWPEEATVAAGCSQLQPAASYLVGELRRRCRLLETTVAERAANGAHSTVQLQMREMPEACGIMTRDEAYELVVLAEGVTITAETPAGVFYGIQSLLQLLPWSTEASCRVPVLKGCRILDYPRFKWRGVLLDTGRHIFTVGFIKKLLDLMALHKLNRFHWHLTEDQGWRIEIRSLTLLTEIGAYRGESKYGGFYTQDQIRDIVKYAEERFIEVVPEIELPGHCMAALACYPELSCTGAVKEVPTQWGVQSDVYCAGKETTFQFLETVLDEVMELFPSKHIHIGGDECPKTRWAACDACQARIKSEDLSGEEQLQTYFINRVAQHLRKQGRCIIGWDEILEGGIPDEAVVMCWRGTIGGVAAAKHKHQVIMTPNTRCYFDYRQSASMQEPGTWYAVLPLEWVYLFDPCCRTGQLDMRLFYPQEQSQDQVAEPMSPDDNETDSKSDIQCAAGQVAINQSKKAVSDAEEAHQQSLCSSLSEADALTDARLSSTQPTSASLSTTPLTCTPTQAASPLADHAQEIASATVNAAPDSEIGQDSNQKLPESGRSMVAVDSGAEEDDSANAPTEEQMQARKEPLMQLQHEQWAQINCRMDPEDQQYIIGGQANLWTEFISDEQTAEYMLLPRLCALAECVWSPVAARNWQSFIDRTHGFLAQLRTAGYNHRALQYRASGTTNMQAAANTAPA